MVLVSGCFLIRDSIGDQVTAKSNWSCSIAASAAAELRAGVPTKPCGIDWKNNPGSERKAKTFLQDGQKGKKDEQWINNSGDANGDDCIDWSKSDW